jgi:polyadenylate-binding protein
MSENQAIPPTTTTTPVTPVPTPVAPVQTPVVPVSGAPTPAPFQSASLYVGDLHTECTEGVLFEIFNRVGPVASIRVCRDAVTRRSLGYSYVNFHNVQDAERALDIINFTDIKSKPCRIMWSQRDPSLRKSGVGNVFIKNLPSSVDNRTLIDTFSVFGNILSCKVVTDEAGAPKGYGYVHFETEEAAKEAILKFNENSIDDQKVFLDMFVHSKDRVQKVDWTNLYVKQFPEQWDEAKLTEVFSAFGEIASLMIIRDPETGKSKQFGFVNFAQHEGADKALNELNNKEFDDESAPGGTLALYVNRAQKKTERTREIKKRIDDLNQERVSKYQGMNLYVKNIDDTLSDDAFRETFAQFGTITSARIMRESELSKGFGFVCYSSPEEATRAVTEMNGKILRGKPIVVTLHQRKEQRRAHLATTHAHRNMRFTPGPGMPMPYMNMYPQGQPQGPGGQYPRNFASYPNGPQGGMPFPGRGGGGSSRGMPFPGRGGAVPGFNGMPNNQFGMYNMPQGGMQGQQYKRAGPMGQQRGGVQDGRNRVPQQGGPNNMQRSPPGGGQRQNMQSNVKFNSQVRNNQVMQSQQQMSQSMPQSMPQSIPMHIKGHDEPLDDQALAAADPAMQKNMIGERLYPLIFVHEPSKAGKITGMLLEMDNAELLNLLESPDALQNKVEEALLVLQTVGDSE